jgi:hypothetical protein
MEKMMNFMHLKPSTVIEVGAELQNTEELDMEMLDLIEFDRAYPMA